MSAKTKVVGKIFGSLAGLVSLQGCASAMETSSMMPIGGVAVAPAGFISFCRREPGECGLGASETPAQLDAALGAANAAQWTALFAQAPGGFTNVVSSGAVAAEPRLDWRLVFRAQSEPQPAAETSAALTLQTDDTPLAVTFPDLAAPLPIKSLLETAGAGDLGAKDPAPEAAVEAFSSRSPFVRPAMSDGLMRLLETTSRSINARIAPDNDDVSVFGEADYWALPLSRGLGNKGNCKHYALEKRKALIEQGVPPQALSLAIVRTRAGETHAVLLVATDRGEFVLDNLNGWVTPWAQAGYTWLERQTPGEPMQWRALAAL